MSEGPLSGVRVVVVNSFPGPGMGGGEVLTLAIVRALASAGAEVKAVTPPASLFGDALAAEGVGIDRAELGPARFGAALRTIAGAAGTGAVLFGTGYWSNLLVRRARRAGRDRVLNLVGVMPRAAGGSPLAKAVRRLADRATILRVDAFAVSAAPIAAELAALGAPRERVAVIPNAIDTDAIRAGAHELPPGFPVERPVIGCVARLETVKGVEYLLRALVKLEGARLALAGVGPLAGSLRELSERLGIAERVRFLGWVPDATALLRGATIVALPSLSEGLPLVALEAMALEKPVVATAVGGTPEAIEDGVTGRLVPPADPDALASALGDLISDPARAAALAAAGRRRVDERFGIARMGAAYVALVGKLARGTSPR